MTAKTTLVFTGSTSHYAIINPVERFPGATLTLTCWVKVEPTGGGAVVSYAVPDRSNEVLLYLAKTSSAIRVYTKNGLWEVDHSIKDGRWHFLAFSRDADNSERVLHVDGVRVASKDTATGPLASGGCLIVGQDQDSLGGDFTSAEAFVGSVRDVIVCDRQSLDHTHQVAEHAGCLFLANGEIHTALRRARGASMCATGSRPGRPPAVAPRPGRSMAASSRWTSCRWSRSKG